MRQRSSSRCAGSGIRASKSWAMRTAAQEPPDSPRATVSRGDSVRGVSGFVSAGVAGTVDSGGGARRLGRESSSDAVCSSSMISVVERRNSAIALPSVRASSGRRLGPSTTSATTRITRSSGMPMPNIVIERREKVPGCQRGRAIVGPMPDGTAVVLDERMLAHDPGRGHPERPERLRVLLDHLARARDLVRLGARAATEDEIALVHAAGHIEHAAATAGLPRVVFDPDTSTSPGSYQAARLAAGSLLTVCDAVLAGEVRNGFA